VPKTQYPEDDEDLLSTNKLLRVIVALMLRPRDESGTLKQQIEVLHDLGLRPTEIAAILRKKPTHINKELSGIRRQRKSEE
jgi:hypothetical protein